MTERTDVTDASDRAKAAATIRRTVAAIAAGKLDAPGDLGPRPERTSAVASGSC